MIDPPRRISRLCRTHRLCVKTGYRIGSRTILVDVLNKDGSVLRAAGTFSADSGVDTKNGAIPFQDQSMTPKPLFNKIYRDYSEMQFTLGDPLNGATQYVLKKAD